MERAGRSQSLVDLHGSGEATSSTPTSGTPVIHQSLMDLRSNTLQTGEILLEAGSPASPGCSTECDPTLLDNDSDSNETRAPAVDDGMDVNMIVDNVITDQPDSTADPLYHQCKTARRMAYVERLVSVTNDGTFGTVVTSPSPQIGHLTDHDNLINTFHGSRIQKGNVTINQSVSISFDPANMACITCKTEHNIMNGNPITVIFSDQNCVSTIEGLNGACISVVRQEDASLEDLFELSREIFENHRVPEGSVFLYGSASYLSRVGTGTYAGDWVTVVSRAGKIWRGIRVCPMVPMILSDCPGTLAREIAEVAAWFAGIYENNPLGMFNTWSAVVSVTESLSVGGIALPHMDSYKISVPSSLSEQCTFTSMTFCAASTRPATLRGLPKDNLGVLVHSLIETVHRCFQTCAIPEIYLARDNNTAAVDAHVQKVVLLGASNLGRCASRFSRANKLLI
jgi:hypothetical protein